MRRLVPFVVDVVLVLVFCAIGRRSHDEAIAAGLLRTFWPFGTGLLVGWAITAAVAAVREGASAAMRFDGRAVWPAGVIVWLSTLIGGMVLRVVSGQGTAFSFVLVAGTVLALFLVARRALAGVARSVAGRSA